MVSNIPGACTPSALDALRQATRQRHQTLDSQLPIASPGAGYRDYVQHIHALHGWLKPLDTQLWSLGWPDAIDAPRRAGKIVLIENDLRLAASAGWCERAAPAVCLSVPHLAGGGAYAIGVAYVIEGSQLGGAVLARRLTGGPAPDAFSYLVGYADATGSMWKQFLSFLGETVTSAEQIAQAVRGACDAFDTLTIWMTPLFLARRSAIG